MHFIHRPVACLGRYNLLLEAILECLKEQGLQNHEDIETIPRVKKLIDGLAKATQKGVAASEGKVQLWRLQHTLDGSQVSPPALWLSQHRRSAPLIPSGRGSRSAQPHAEAHS